MTVPDYWNHITYVVPPKNLGRIEECIDTLFGWKTYAKREGVLGYHLHPDFRKGLIFFQGANWAEALDEAISRLEQTDAQLAEGLRLREQGGPDNSDHNGFRVDTMAEWERRLAVAKKVERERPDFQLKVGVRWPKADAPIKVYQCFCRIGLLGPIRNTIEMQCVVGSP